MPGYLKNQSDRPTIHPVVLDVAKQVGELTPKEKTIELSRLARIALARSAEYSGVVIDSLEKGERGRPIPVNGVFWSLAHSREWVAAVTAPYDVGIDIERIAPFTPEVMERTADVSEWDLARPVDEEIFCRFWTAKEAVLKAVGMGLGGLSKCKVRGVPDENHLELTYEESRWIVSSIVIRNDYFAAITAPAPDVEWHIDEL